MISIKRTKSAPSASPASHSSSAETIANNVDLLNQILQRLPTKSLLKFKCVSNQWQSLISSPSFARCRKSHVSSPCALLVENFSRKAKRYEFEFVSLDSSHSEAPFKSLTFVNGPSKARILQSCNGLLLCASYESRKETIYYVYSPTTKQCTQLPPLELPSTDIGVNLAFDPLKSPYYKVVCVGKCANSLEEDVYEPDDEVVYEIDVYSSKERRWMSSTTGPFTISGYIAFGGGVFCSGAIHWLSRWGNSLYLDVDEDQLHEMPARSIPEDREERRDVYFGESRGHLHLVEIYEPPSIKFNVYEMFEDYSGWNVKYQVDLGAVVTAFPEMAKSYVEPDSLHHYTFEILCVSRGETDEDSFLVLHIPSKMIRYSLKDGTSFEKLCDFGPDVERNVFGCPSYMLWVNAYQYFESLACV